MNPPIVLGKDSDGSVEVSLSHLTVAIRDASERGNLRSLFAALARVGAGYDPSNVVELTPIMGSAGVGFVIERPGEDRPLLAGGISLSALKNEWSINT